jgi:isoleucyl-tRNA synthetase
VRLNRGRLKGQEGSEESITGLSTLYEVLLTMAVLMAPFTPFLTEFLYQHLRKLHKDYQNRTFGFEVLGFAYEDLLTMALGHAESVHYMMLPTFLTEESLSSSSSSS